MRAFAAAAVLAQLVAAAVDLASIPRESSSNIVPGVYIVELSTGSHLKRGFQSPHEELYHDLSRRGALWEVTREFSCDILTGATLKLGSEADLLKLAQSDGVQSIFPVYSHPMPEPINPYIPTGPEDPRCHRKDALSTHLMTGVDKLHAKGIHGQGIKIGIIDTGIDYTHPALGGKFGPGNKVIGGYDFVGDAYRGSSGPAPVPDNDPLDQCNGHGTHVAGILGANPENLYNISGVAYKSSLNAYRIFGCSGSASDDLIVAALMRAWQDGNDVITLSLGIPDGWTTGMTGVVASRIADKGKIVVATAGNDGAYGSWYPNSPGAGSSVISVGSVNNDIINVQNATLSNGHTFPYYSFLPLPFPSNLPMYATSDITATADACKPLPGTTPDLSNYLVVIRRGGCALVDKFANVVAKGGRYYLLYDNIVEPLGAFDFGNYTTAGISKEDGEYLVQQAIPANVTISFFDTPYDYPLATGGLMSSFSSYSPTYDMYLKPAVAAPGGEILSTFPVKLGAYKIDSGTSMAAPFVAGAAALLLQTHGKTAVVAKSAKSLFESTALPVRVSAGNSSLFETAAHQGAGLIQVNDAIKNQGSMSPAELLLNDTASFKGSHTVTIRNNGWKSVTYDLTHVAAGTVNTINGITARTAISLVSNAANVSLSPSKLTVWPGTSATFTAKFTAPTGLNASSFPVYSGFIKATGSDGSSFHSTYLGLAAPIKSMRIVDNTTAYFGTKLPLIQGNNSKPINDTTVFTMNGTDFPLFIYRLVGGSPLIRVDLIKSTTKVTPNLRKKRFTPLPQLGQSIPTDHHAVHLHPVELPVEKRSIWDWLMPYKGSTYGGTFASIPIVGTIYQRDYQGRNSPASTTGANGYESIKVDKFANGTAIPNGNYKILLRALKITGNPRNQEDYEVWTSPELQIKRT